MQYNILDLPLPIFEIFRLSIQFMPPTYALSSSNLTVPSESKPWLQNPSINGAYFLLYTAMSQKANTGLARKSTTPSAMISASTEASRPPSPMAVMCQQRDFI